VVVSKGPPPTPVPDVSGKNQKQATKDLEHAGFTVTLKIGFSDSVPKGTVIRTEPASGTKAPYGSAIALVVSVGPQTFPCPNFQNMSLEQATALAKADGLHVSALAVPGAQAPYTVFSQVPVAGSTVSYGDSITLYYA
jgi:serine/threonine-protein kinase